MRYRLSKNNRDLLSPGFAKSYAEYRALYSSTYEKKGLCRPTGNRSYKCGYLFMSFTIIADSGAPLTEAGGTNAPASAKPAEAHPPALIMLAINEAIRHIANMISVGGYPFRIHPPTGVGGFLRRRVNLMPAELLGVNL